MILKIKDVDWLIGYLVELLRQADIADKLNIIIVSDHGMADMKNETIFVYDYVDKKLIDSNKTLFGIVSNIYPIDDEAVTKLFFLFLNICIVLFLFFLKKPKVFEALSKVPNLKVYYKENIPKELYFQKSNRIAPIVAIADEGYVMNTFRQTLKGNHGFENQIESMRAIFLARGPSFKPNMKISSLNNVDVYPLLCDLMQIKCNPNNGSMDPFKDVLNSKNISSKIYSFNYVLIYLYFLKFLFI